MIDVILVNDGLDVVAGAQGPQGEPAIMDLAVGFENFTAGQVLRGPVLAHPLVATNAASVAHAAAAPTTTSQAVTIFNNGVQVGVAVWSVGAVQGVVTYAGSVFIGAKGDFLTYQAPNPLDAAFSHFAITHAGP